MPVRPRRRARNAKPLDLILNGARSTRQRRWIALWRLRAARRCSSGPGGSAWGCVLHELPVPRALLALVCQTNVRSHCTATDHFKFD